MSLCKISSIDLSKYILSKTAEMPLLKLQKLLYYIEAYHLAYFGQSLIDDEFEAWLHGPVSRTVWATFKNGTNGFERVQLSTEEKESIIHTVEHSLSQEQVEFIEDVLHEFGDKTAYHLECLTYEEPPWSAARKGYDIADKCEETISKELMFSYYRKKLYGKEKVEDSTA